MDDLIAFLRARLDEDEATAARAVRVVGDVPGGADWRFGDGATDEAGTYWHIKTTPPNGDTIGIVELVGCGVGGGGGVHESEIARHIARHDPARVLAEVDAKRRIVDAYERWQGRADSGEELSEFERGSLAGLYSVCRTLAEAHPAWRP